MKRSPIFLSLLAGTLLLSASPFVLAQEMQETQEYTYNGHPVSKQYYDALQLAKQAEPLMHANDYAKAEPLLRDAVKQLPDNGDVMVNYANTLARVGKPKEAIEYYDKASKLQTNQENLYIGWSSAYGALGQLDDSLRICKEFLKKFPKSQFYPQMANQASSLEHEIKRINKNSGGEQSDKAADNYLQEATGGKIHRWKSSDIPVKVYMADSSKVPHWKPEYDEFMKQAFQDWGAASNGALSFKFVDNPKDAKITCSWSADVSGLKNSAEQGEANTFWTPDGMFTNASITMMTVPPVNFNLVLTDARIKQAALHEVGHVLGLMAHSSNPDDVMYFATTNGPIAARLSARDIKTLSMIYGDGNTAGGDSK
jgi:predicted Zn-dependent protease